MKNEYYKMHGAGNDFIVTFEEKESKNYNKNFITKICNRRLGIGGDGFISISNSKTVDYKMNFYNCDGSQAGMCGNGLRCASKYVYDHINPLQKIVFETKSGNLTTEILSNKDIKIEIPIISSMEKINHNNEFIFYGNTGVPHVVKIVDDVEEVNILTKGRDIRYSDYFMPNGTNVNFIELSKEKNKPVKIRTYERGVEEETLACGTGIAACAIVLNKFYNFESCIKFKTVGDDILNIEFDKNKVYLIGNAVEVFKVNNWEYQENEK